MPKVIIYSNLKIMYFYYLNSINKEENANNQPNYPQFLVYPQGFNFFQVGNLTGNNQIRSDPMPASEIQREIVIQAPLSERQVDGVEVKSTESSKKKKIKSLAPKCQEYIPYHSKKKSHKKVYQNVKRNIMPNIVHQIFCFLQKKSKSGHLVQNYLKRQSDKIDSNASMTRFYNYQKLIKDKTNNYLNERAISELNRLQDPNCLIYTTDQQSTYMKINRILMRYFLKKQIETVILTSVRMKENTRIWHFEMKRKLLEDAEQLFSLD